MIAPLAEAITGQDHAIMLAISEYNGAVRRMTLAPYYGTHGDYRVEAAQAALNVAYRELIRLTAPSLSAWWDELDAQAAAQSATERATEAGLNFLSGALSS